MTARPIRNEGILTAMGAAPFRRITRAYRYLSSVPGFSLVANVATTYCALLSIEAIMVAVPVDYPQRADFPVQSDYKAAVELVRRERRFVPKFAVNDGAELRRLFPFDNIYNLVVNDVTKGWAWMPEFVKSRARSNYWTVWNNWALFLLATSGAITIQRFESVFLRKKSAQLTKARFEVANRLKAVNPDPKAMAIAKIRASEHNRQGMGEVTIGYAGILVLYLIETGAFLASFSGAGNAGINTLYWFLSVFGFELFDRFTDDALLAEYEAISHEQ